MVIDKPNLRVKDTIKTLRLPEYSALICKKRDVKRELKTHGLFIEEQRYQLYLHFPRFFTPKKNQKSVKN